MGWTPATGLNAKQKISFPTKNIREEGFIFVYLIYPSEAPRVGGVMNESSNYMKLDDLKITHTKTNVIQYREYYPFGLQAGNRWTRDNMPQGQFLSLKTQLVNI